MARSSLIYASVALASLLCAGRQTLAFSSGTKRCHTIRNSSTVLPARISDNDAENDSIGRRRVLQLVAGILSGVAESQTSQAAVTDETNAFANTAPDSSYSNLQSNKPTFGVTQLPSDELVIKIPKSALSQGLGIELNQVDFRTNIRVFVKSVTPNSPASKLGIKKDYVVVSVNGKSAERTDVQGVALMVSKAAKATPADGVIEFRLRDPSVFRESLQNLSTNQPVTTQVAPAGDTTQRNQDGSIRVGTETSQADQRLTVSQLIPPKLCNRKATTDDLMEISYVGTIVETGEVFDGSAIKIDGEGIPGRGNDVSLYFVLGKQPFGQFPPGWDVGLEGMCVGERRRVIIPPALAFGSQGIPRRRIPPNATLQYDITLVSLNGLATPQ